MQIVELDIKLPYEGRGKILGRLYDKVRGRIRDIHFFPPDAEGMSEIKMELAEDNASRLLSELKKIVRNGKVTFKVLSDV